MPRHYFPSLIQSEIELIDIHWMKYFDPEKLRGKPGWEEPKDGEDRNRVGLLSESAQGTWINIPVEDTLANRPETKAGHWVKDAGFDVVMCGYQLDVKCQPTRYNPKPHWLWNVPAEIAQSPNKDCDGYIWMHKKVGDDYNYEIIGWMYRKDFLEQATFHKEGAPMAYNNGKYKMDTLDLTEDHMMDLGELRRSMF